MNKGEGGKSTPKRGNAVCLYNNFDVYSEMRSCRKSLSRTVTHSDSSLIQTVLMAAVTGIDS